MVRGGFRHLIVLEQGETVGILSVRDVVRCWTDDGAICPVPARRPWGEAERCSAGGRPLMACGLALLRSSGAV